MQAEHSSIFDSLAESTTPSTADGPLIRWLVGRMQRAGDAGAIQQLVADIGARGLDLELQSWLGRGAPRPIGGRQLGGLIRPDGVFDDEALNELQTHTGLSREALMERLAALLPGVLKNLMPRGEVPSWHALEYGLTSMQRSLRAA